MKEHTIGEWIKGPFANATIEGFITGKTKGYYLITVKDIEEPVGALPDYLKVGATFKIPEIVLHEFFRSFNKDQQENIILLAKHLGNYQWVMDLTSQFYNPFIQSRNTFQTAENCIDSIIHNTYVSFTDDEKLKLFEYYQLALDGYECAEKITSPEHITARTLDSVIAAIVLLYDCPEGISYVKELITKYGIKTFSEM